MRFTMKQYVNTTGIAILVAIGLVACNNGSNTSTSTNPGGGGTTPPMTLSYNIDGHNINGGASLSVFQDSGWHLLTLTANESYTATAIQGVAYRFNLNGSWGGINTPAGSAGLSVVTDPTLNTCATAVFQNQGDSCSVRFRIAYDTALSSTIPSNTSMVMFPGNYTTPNINFNSVPPFSVAPNPTQAVADIRVIQPVESSYWQSTAISESPNLYQIIQVQNGSPQESLNISTISGLTNPNYFSLVNRSTPAGQNDPVYGSYAQCATSTTANPANNQVSNLPALNNNCILVYQVTQQISQQTVESDIVNIYFPNQQTNIFPSGNNTQQFIASYTVPFFENYINSSFNVLSSDVYQQAVYNNGVWITFSMYGGGDVIVYSIDNGITWNQATILGGNFVNNCANDENPCLNSISSQNGLLTAATANNSGIYYSLDGITWTATNIITGDFYAPVYANGIWVIGSSDTQGIYYSTDGKIWDSSNINSGNALIAYGNGDWIAIINNTFYSSVDGKNWVLSSNVNISGYLNSPIFANGIWVGLYSNATSGTYYSIDGKSWAKSNIESINTPVGPEFINDKWFLLDADTGFLFYSLDGQTWLQSNIPKTSPPVNNDILPTYINGGWYFVSGYNELYFSEDGVTWMLLSSSLTSLPIFANNAWRCGGSNGIYSSEDGKTWNLIANLGDIIYNIEYNGNLWVAFGGNSQYYSLDGNTWHDGGDDNAEGWMDASFANGYWLFLPQITPIYMVWTVKYSTPVFITSNLNTLVSK